MEIEELHHSLDSNKGHESLRQDLIAFLKECRATLPEELEERSRVAYAIASLLSTSFAQSLSQSDIIDSILTLAGELESPDDDASAKWQELCTLIDNVV